MKIHIVQKGDTLWELSKKYNVDFEQLKAVNSQLTNPDMIMPGMKIKIPSGSVHVKKEAYVGDVVKKEAPKKEMPKEAPLPPPAPMPVEAPKMQMPQWQPIQFHQQPITVQQHQHVNEWDVNFNVYKPQQQPKPQPIPKMEMPKMPKPPAPPKVEKPKMKKPEIKPTAPAPKQVKPMPMQIPMAEQPKPMPMPMPIAEQPKQMIMPQYQPCPPVAMPQMQYGVPCPPYYPVSPIMPGCGPSSPMQQTNCGSPGYGQSMGQMWPTNAYGHQHQQQQQQLSPMPQPSMTPYMQGQQYPYQNHFQPPQSTQQFTQPQPYVPQQQHQPQPYAPYPHSPGWGYGYHQTQQTMPMYGQNRYPIPMHEEYDDLED